MKHQISSAPTADLSEAAALARSIAGLFCRRHNLPEQSLELAESWAVEGAVKAAKTWNPAKAGWGTHLVNMVNWYCLKFIRSDFTNARREFEKNFFVVQISGNEDCLEVRDNDSNLNFDTIIAPLSERERIVLRYRYYMQYTIALTSELLCMNCNEVRKVESIALKKLRSLLA